MVEFMSCTRVSLLSLSMNGRNRSRCSPFSYSPSGALSADECLLEFWHSYEDYNAYTQSTAGHSHIAPPAP